MGSGLKYIFADALTDTYTAAQGTAGAADNILQQMLQEQKGKIRFDEDGNAYRFVVDGSSDTRVKGDVVCYDLSLAGAALFDTILTPATADLALLAGVCLSAIPDLGYGYIQISGYNATVNVDHPGTTAIVALDSIKGADGLAYAVKDVVLGTAPTVASHIMALEGTGTSTISSANTTNIMAIIKCQPLGG